MSKEQSKLVQRIRALCGKRNAVILAHNYMTPDVFALVGDFRGDSLQLAREAAVTDAKVIVQAGVHFMAETSKILSPDKTVLIPDMRAGCSLASWRPWCGGRGSPHRYMWLLAASRRPQSPVGTSAYPLWELPGCPGQGLH